MSDGLGSYFSGMSEENQKDVQKSMNNAQNDRKDVIPGKYVMAVKTFAWKDKKSGDMNIVPEFVETRKHALQLKIVLEVADDGTEVVPKGSAIFHNVTISPVAGSDISKIDTIMRFSKPVLQALTGVKDPQFTEEWLKEYCSVKYEEQEDGKYKLTKDHKMKNKVFATVDEDTTQSGQIVSRIKFINPIRPGDKSMTYAIEQTSGVSLDKPEDQKAQDDASFNFGLNDANKKASNEAPVATSGASAPEDADCATGATGNQSEVKQEDF